MKGIDSLYGEVLTLDESSDYLGQVQDFLHVMHDSDVEIKNKLEEIFEARYFDLMSHYAKSNDFPLDDVDRVKEMLNEVQHRVMELPLMTLLVAFHPRQLFVDKVVEWLVDNGPGPLKLEVKSVPAIVGGIVLEWNGNIKDYSLANDMSDEKINESI